MRMHAADATLTTHASLSCPLRLQPPTEVRRCVASRNAATQCSWRGTRWRGSPFARGACMTRRTAASSPARSRPVRPALSPCHAMRVCFILVRIYNFYFIAYIFCWLCGGAGNCCTRDSFQQASHVCLFISSYDRMALAQHPTPNFKSRKLVRRGPVVDAPPRFGSKVMHTRR